MLPPPRLIAVAPKQPPKDRRIMNTVIFSTRAHTRVKLRCMILERLYIIHRPYDSDQGASISGLNANPRTKIDTKIDTTREITSGDVFPIPGTKNVKYLEENWGALKVPLTAEEEAQIRNMVDEAEIAGDRGASFSAYAAAPEL
jgi:hypothetical protein